MLGVIISKNQPNGRVLSDAPTRARIQRLTSDRVSLDPFSRTRFQWFQWFVSDPPHSYFKKLIILTPRLIQGLHTMSLAKAVPDGIKDKECKRFTLREHPCPVPYVPEKDPVQETVSALKVTRVSRLPSAKTQSFTSPSGTLVRARLFSCT